MTSSPSDVHDRRAELICGLDLRMGRAARIVLKPEEMRRLRVLGRSGGTIGESGSEMSFAGFGIFSKLRLWLWDIWIAKRRLRASEGVI